jgi:glycosyltransferase involved in cell wall biosynthesis
MLQKKVSIILPTYNRSSKCISVIKDVFNQTYKDIELILINDGSDEKNTYELEKFLEENKDDENFKKINYIYHENKGIAASINIGIDVFTGDYMTWISDDNKIIYDFIQVLLELLVKNNKKFAYSNYIINKSEKKFRIYNKYKDISHLINNFRGMVSFMWSRELIKNIGYFNLEYSGICEDYDYEIRTFLETDEIIHTSKYLIEYNIYKDYSDQEDNRQKEMIEMVKIKYNNYIKNMVEDKLD